MEVEQNIAPITMALENAKIKITLPFEEDLEKIIKGEGFVSHEVKSVKLDTDGGNYLAELYKINVTGETIDGPKVLNLFVKHQIEIDIPTVCKEEAYENEIFAYHKLFNIFKELENEFKVPSNERYKSIKFYNSSNKNIIIMEDVSLHGFGVLLRQQCITLNYAKLSIEELAKFHALSFAIQKHRPDFYKEILNLKSAAIYNDKFYEFGVNIATQMSSLIDSEDKKRRFEKVIFDLINKMPKMYRPQKDRVNCLCHNDYRVANILCKQQNNDTVEVIPVDFQLLEIGAPLNDFFYFILGSSSQKFRKQHLDYLKEFYYDSLTKSLNNFNIDVRDVYPRNCFDEDYHRIRLHLGLPITTIVIMFFLSPYDEFPDLSKDDIATMNVIKNDLLTERFNELIDDFIEWGYL